MEKMDSKVLKQRKGQFDLHVSLIAAVDGCTTAEAKFRAWLEGIDGLNRRLGQGELFRDGRDTPEEKAPEEKTSSKK